MAAKKNVAVTPAFTGRNHAQYSIIRPYITRIRTLQMAEQNKRAVEQSRQKTQTRKKNTYLE